MLDISQLLIKAMKKNLFENNIELNNAARIILGEMKTKCIDIKGEITTEVQYKMLQKMKKERENSIKIYAEAIDKTQSENAKENLNKAKIELEPINLFLIELETEMPKRLNEDQTLNVIQNIISSIGNDKPNKGQVMKELKLNPMIDMAIAAKLVNSLEIFK